MSRRQEVVRQILAARVSAVIRTDDQAVGEAAIEAAIAGGFRVVEFTLTTPGAIESIRRFAARGSLLVGAGTVLAPESARAAVAAGARFLVSPICDPEVLAEAARLDVPSIPGAFTPTEMLHAHRSGADIVKVFPAVPGGPDYIRAVRGPLPNIPLFPTAGVTIENFTDYLNAGCVGVGFVKPLFEPGDLAARRYDAITARARTIMTRLGEWSARSRT